MEGEVTTSIMATIISAMSDAFDLVGTIITEITTQPVLLFCLAAALIPIGIGIFRRLLGSVQG